jgi:hypothetical protein
MRRIAFSPVAVVALAGVVTYMVPHLDTPTAGSTHGAPLRETVTVAADVPIPNLPGKRLVSHVVDYPPGGGLGPAPSRPLGFHLRLCPLGRDPEPGRERACPRLPGR